MVNPAVIDYVRDAENKGYTEAQLREFLLQNGYTDEHIEEAFRELKHPTLPPRTEASARKPVLKRATDYDDIQIKERKPWLVLILSFTCIYFIFWLVATTNELRRNNKPAPSPWLLLVPIVAGVAVLVARLVLPTTPFGATMAPFMVSALAIMVIVGVLLTYFWRYSNAVHRLSKFPAVGLFFLLLIFFPAATLVAQTELNKYAA